MFTPGPRENLLMCFSSATGWHNRKPAEAFQDNIFAKMDSRLRIKSDLTDELLSQGVWRIRRTRLRQYLEGRPITFCCVRVHYDDFWCALKKTKTKKNTPKSNVLLPVLHVSSLSFTQPLIQACQFVFSTFARRVEAKHKKKTKNNNTHMLRNIPTLSSSEQRLNMFGFF